jgi:hypothetical protein
MTTLFRNSITKAGVSLTLALAGMLGSGAAMAAGTLAGTAITNLATLNYAVGGTAQTPIGSSATGNTTGAGTATSFVVDNKINLLVTTTDTTFVSVIPGQTLATATATQVATFSVTNTGNSPQDFSLATAFAYTGAQTLSTFTPTSVTDTFNPTACSAFVESGTLAGYQVGQDTAIYIDELAPDTSKTVYVVCAIPLAQVNNDIAVVSLTATALVGGTAGVQGAALVETTGPNTTGVDIVFADGAGAGGDIARDAKYSSLDALKVVTAVLTVSKTVAPVCDPFNGSTSPKSIPLSFVRYTITIANTGAASATLTTVGDALTSLVTFDPNLITGAGAPATATSCTLASGTPTSVAGSGFVSTVTGSTRASAASPRYYTTSANSDGVDLTGGNTITATFAQVLPAEAGYTAGELKAGESVSISYQVQIN